MNRPATGRPARHRLRTTASIASTVSLLAGLLTAISVLATPTTAVAAPGDAFDRTRAQVFVAQDNPTRLYKAVTDAAGTVSFNSEGPVRTVAYNALAYNVQNDYLYATVLNGLGSTQFPTGSLIRIGQNGTLTRVGTATYPTSLVGAFGPDNLYYKTGTGSTLQAVNVTTGAVVRTVPLTGGVGADFTYKDGFLWTLGGSEILRTDPTTGVVTSFPFTNPRDGVNGVAGAAWTFGNGNLGFSSNTPGTVTQIAVTNPASASPTFTVVSQTPGPSSSNNDGAASPGLPTDLSITKTAPATFVPGDPITYTLTVRNNGDGVSSGYTVRDELPTGMTGIASTTPGCSVSGRVVTCSGGELEVGATTTVTITATTPVGASTCLVNTATILANEADPVDSNNQDSAESCAGRLAITKTSDATSQTRVGDTVTYTVTATNEGAADYTAAAPAVLLDDLSGVLDDASYNDDAAATVDGASAGATGYAAPLLSWSGPLATGESVELTYSVTLTAGGDGSVRNVAFASSCDPADADCDTDTTPSCVAGENPDTGLACATQTIRLPRLEINKSASVTALPAVGDTVTYTVVATNAGPGDYSTAAPAVVIDDLSEVLDDGSLDESSVAADATGDLGFDSPRITWRGALASGDSVTMTYTIEYTGEGDHSLVNVAFGPPTTDVPTPVCLQTAAGGIDADTGLPCDRVTVPGAGLSLSKTVDPVSGTAVGPGDLVTYTLTFDNDGSAAATVDHTDYLADVLDDAEMVSVVAESGLSVDDSNAGRLVVTGSVPVNQQRRVTYTVRVLPAAERGDHMLGNVLAPSNEDPPAPGEVCAGDSLLCTANPVREIVSTKSVDPSSGTAVKAGDELMYTLTFQNRGGIAGDVDAVDDLTHLLDDAEITTAAQSSDAALTVGAVAGGRLPVSGTLAPGQTVTVKYTATVGADGERGDNLIGNFLLSPDDDTPGDPGCVAGSETCTTNPISEIVDSKSVDPASGTTVAAGDELTYTLTFQNIGKAAGTVDAVDDLTHVLDDAAVTSGPVSSAPALEVSVITANRYAITGELEPGQTVTVRYTVTVGADGERGDNVLGNFLLGPDDNVPGLPLCLDEDCTLNPIPEITSTKSVDPASGTTVGAGQELTYTLTYRNTGAASGPVDQVDDLTHVLDDAAIVTGPASSDPDVLSVTPAGTDRFSITGDLPSGRTVTVRYTVKVAEHGDRGDSILGNFLLAPGADVPDDPVCDVDAVDCTVNAVSEYIDSKSVNPASGGVVTAGDTLTYTLTFTNVGGVPVDVDRVDDLSHLLDDATISAASTPSADALTVSSIVGARFTVNGELGVGQTVTVRYTAIVNPDGERGDHVMANFLLDPDDETPEDPASCGDGDCTVNRAAEIHQAKSVSPRSGTPVVAGQELTYTLTFSNTGAATGTVDAVDDLTHVLDDAAMSEPPVASDAALEVQDLGGDSYRIVGDLEAGQIVTVRYTVTVNPEGEQGDQQIANFLLRPGEEAPDEPVCDGAALDCTANPIGQIVAEKSSDPASDTSVKDKQTVTYTLTFRNVGKGAADVAYSDNLSDVLDDATMVRAPKASGSALAVSTRHGVLEVTGNLAAGAAATVTYAVKVDAKAKHGNGTLANYLLAEGQSPPDACVVTDPMCTVHDIAGADDILPDTGGPMPAWALLAGIVLLASGLGLTRVGRRH